MNGSARSRLAKLEAKHGKILGRFFGLIGGTGAPGEAEAFLRSHGYEPADEDMILVRTVYRTGEAGVEVVPMALEFMVRSTTSHEAALAELEA